MKKNIILNLLIFSSLLLVTSPVFGDSSGMGKEYYEFIEEYYQYFVIVGSIIGVVLVVIGGAKIGLSAGNAAKLNEGKKILTGAFLGLGVLLSSYLIVYQINPGILVKEIISPSPKEDPESLDGLYLKNEATNKEVRLLYSEANLGRLGMDEKVDSYSFIQPSGEEKFAAIFFSNSDFKGECFYEGENATEVGDLPFGPRSVFVFKTKQKTDQTVRLYNYDDGECTDVDLVGYSLHPEQMDISAYDAPQKLMHDDPGKEHWIEVSSIRIDSKEVLVLLETRNKEECQKGNSQDQKDGSLPNSCFHCQLIWKPSDTRNCVPLKYDYVYYSDAVDTIKPGYIKLFHMVSN